MATVAPGRQRTAMRAGRAFNLPPPLSVRLPAFSSMQQLAVFCESAEGKRVLGAQVPVWDALFEVRAKPARLKVPPEFAERVRGLFSAYPGGTADLAFAERQTVVTVYNRWTHDHSMFNELRRYRPGYRERLPDEDQQRVHDEFMANAGADKCDFCAVTRTAEDPWGRIRGRHCYTASNAAKYEAHHGLLVATEHDPMRMSPELMADYIGTAMRWFAAAHDADPTALFPNIALDTGSRASASQPHFHMQIALGHRRFTRAAAVRDAALAFEATHMGLAKPTGAAYWEQLVAAHETVGLAVRRGGCALLSSVTPTKERELIVVARTAAASCFGEMAGLAATALVEDAGTRAYSMGVMPEPFAATSVAAAAAEAPGYPAIARVVDRGSPLDKRSDVGSMELFGAYNVGADPFAIMPRLVARVAAMLPPADPTL